METLVNATAIWKEQEEDEKDEEDDMSGALRAALGPRLTRYQLSWTICRVAEARSGGISARLCTQLGQHKLGEAPVAAFFHGCPGRFKGDWSLGTPIEYAVSLLKVC